MKVADIKQVGVIGGGVMGSGIAQTIATAGYVTFCLDLSEAILEKARNVIMNGRYGLKTGTERGKITKEQAERALANLRLTTKITDLKDCDVVIESIGGASAEDLENISTKLKLFAELDKLVKQEAVFASNTSFLTIADLAVAVKRKDKFLGMHWFRPPVVLKAVELTYTRDTSEETMQLMEAFCERLGKKGFRVKDVPGSPGFIGNRLYRLVATEARKMVKEGIATPEAIDGVMELGYGWTMGIFQMGAAFTTTRQEMQGKK